MSGVVLRCANCGTTQSTSGECQACHEQDVRFYCTRHTPGLWLTTQVCSQCGAEYGKELPPDRERAPPRPGPGGRFPRRPERPEKAPKRPRPWGPLASRDEPREEPRRMDSRAAIERLLREYYRRRVRVDEDTDVEIARGPSVRPLAGGCLRIILMFFLLSMLMLYVLSSLGGMYLAY
jgi:hypothetical protein